MIGNWFFIHLFNDDLFTWALSIRELSYSSGIGYQMNRRVNSTRLEDVFDLLKAAEFINFLTFVELPHIGHFMVEFFNTKVLKFTIFV